MRPTITAMGMALAEVLSETWRDRQCLPWSGSAGESAYTTDKHNRLETLTEHRDEREEEQRPLAAPTLPVVAL
jgi:hypothetical protein